MTLRLHIAFALVAALGLAGCGVKGPLEPPPGAQVAPPEQTAAASSQGTSSQGSSSQGHSSGSWGSHGSKKTTDPLSGVNRPDRPFILDGLL